MNIGFPKIFKEDTRSYSISISMIASCTCTCSCKGICLSNGCIHPNILAVPLIEIIMALCHLHPLVEIDFLPFINDFHPKTNLVLDR
jgi:hypothetical protein